MAERTQLQVVHVVRQFHPGVGGLENFVEQLATRQAAAGHRVRVATLDRIFHDPGKRCLPARGEHHGVEIVRMPFKGSQRYPLAPQALAAVRDADLIHVHGVDFFADYLAATATAHRRPMVLSTHGGFFHTRFARLAKQLYFQTVSRATLSQFGAVIACSIADEQLFKRIAGSRVTLIPNPVDIDKFAGLADPYSMTMIYFGRLSPNKEMERLLDWFAELADRNPVWRLIIAGKPMGVEPGSIRARAGKLGIADRVMVHESPSDDELRELIGRSSMYVTASSYEGFGLAAVEAASAGLFPVLSDIPPFRDTCRRMGMGQLVDFAKPASWPASYQALQTANQQFRSNFSAERARETLEPFAWSAVISRFDEVYARVLGHSKRRIGAVSVEVTDRESATEKVLTAANERRQMMVTFANAHTVNLAQRSPDLQSALDQALVLNDGVGLEIASRALFGAAFPENLNGTDFTPHLLRCAGGDLRLFLLGSPPGVAEQAAQRIETRFPRARVVGMHHGFFGADEESEILEAIRRSGANLVLAAMGQPRQEIWAARYYRQIDAPVVCVGAFLDIIAGRFPRAPVALRKMRMEWAYRLAREPRRLSKRYLLGNALFLSRVLLQRLVGSRI